jgi:hypothetical protein
MGGRRRTDVKAAAGQSGMVWRAGGLCVKKWCPGGGGGGGGIYFSGGRPSVGTAITKIAPSQERV